MTLFIMKFIKKQSGFFGILCFITVLNSLLSLVLPYFSGAFVDMLIKSPSKANVVNFAINIFVIGLVIILFTFVGKILMAYLVSNNEYFLNQEIISHIQKIPLETFNSRFVSSYLTNRITTDVSTLVRFYMFNIFVFFINIITLITVFAIIYFISAHIFFITLLFVPIYILCYIIVKKYLKIAQKKYKESQNQYAKVIYNQIDQVYFIKANSSFDRSTECLGKGYNKHFKFLFNLSKISEFYLSIDSILASLFQAIVLIIGGFQII